MLVTKPSEAVALDGGLACTAIADPHARLACYDDVNGRRAQPDAYRAIDVLDLKAEGASLADAAVKVEGYGFLVSSFLDLASEPTGKITVHVDVDALPVGVKRRLITDCGQVFDRSACKIEVTGRAMGNPYDPGAMKAEAVRFLN